jgi:hypothetical protein
MSTYSEGDRVTFPGPKRGVRERGCIIGQWGWCPGCNAPQWAVETEHDSTFEGCAIPLCESVLSRRLDS